MTYSCFTPSLGDTWGKSHFFSRREGPSQAAEDDFKVTTSPPRVHLISPRGLQMTGGLRSGAQTFRAERFDAMEGDSFRLGPIGSSGEICPERSRATCYTVCARKLHINSTPGCKILKSFTTSNASRPFKHSNALIGSRAHWTQSCFYFEEL